MKRHPTRSPSARSAPTMTDQAVKIPKTKHRALERWIAECAAAVNLTPEWSIDVATTYVAVDDDGDSIWASTYTDHVHKEASLTVSARLLNMTATVVRATIAHELMHVWLAEYADASTRAASSVGPAAADEVHKLLERTCDGMGRLLAPMLPMPPERLHGSMSVADYRLADR